MKSINYAKLVNKKPTQPLEIAIKGMLPKGVLGRNLFRNLRIYEDDNYKQMSQKPKLVKFKI